MTSKVALLEKLGQAEDTLNRLKARYFLLRAFQEQLDDILGRRKADILNDHVWTMVFDTRDALAMHLTSWSKGMAGRGGLFGHLNSNRGALYVRKPKSGQDDSVHRRKAFERLFPGAVERNKVIEADVNQLTERFIAILARVRNDRSKTLAHIFERDAQLGRRLLTPRGYAQVFTKLERMLNDLRFVIDDSSRSYTDLSWADSEAVAKDLVDMALFGTVSQVLHDFGISDGEGKVAGDYYWRFRERHYAGRKKRRMRTSAG